MHFFFSLMHKLRILQSHTCSTDTKRAMVCCTSSAGMYLSTCRVQFSDSQFFHEYYSPNFFSASPMWLAQLMCCSAARLLCLQAAYAFFTAAVM